MAEFKDFILKYKYIFLFLLGIIIQFFCCAYNFITPVMYAEDGRWFGNIMTGGLMNTVLYARSDYFVFILAVLLKIADIVDIVVFSGNIKYVPYLISIISYIFITLVAIMPFLTLGKRMNWLGKLFLYFGILLLPLGFTNTEVLGRILQLHFYMWIITFFLLVYRYDNKDKRKILIVITDLLLLSIVATFPATLLLILVYVVIELYGYIKRNFLINKKKKEKIFTLEKLKLAWKNENKKFSTYTFIMFCLLCFILGVCILLKMSHSSKTAEIGNSKNIIEFLVRGICYLFIFPFYENLNNTMGVFLLLLTVFFYIINYFMLKKESRKIYILSLLSLFSITIITLITRNSLTASNHLNNYSIRYIPDRYYITMNLASLIPMGFIISDCFQQRHYKKIHAMLLFLYFIIIRIVFSEQIFYYKTNHMKELYPGLYTIRFDQRLNDSYAKHQLSEDGLCYIVDIDPSWIMLVPIERMEKSVLK